MVHVSDGYVLVEAKDLTAHLNLQREYYYCGSTAKRGLEVSTGAQAIP